MERAHTVRGTDHGIGNCCAALRRILEQGVYERGTWGRALMEVELCDGIPQSYRASILVNPATYKVVRRKPK